MKKAIPYLFLIIVFAIAGWYFFTGEPEAVQELPPPQLPSVIPAQTQQIEPQVEEIVEYPLAQPEPEPEIIPEPLPQLNESDSELRQSLSEIVGANQLAVYLVKDQAISRMVATIDSLTSRQVPVEINPVKSVDDKLIVDSEGERTILSAQNFARYDGYIALIGDLDVEALMMNYQRYSPLFQEAWEENGGEGLFNDRLVEVIDHLLGTPDVPGPVYLIKPEAFYLYEEPELEVLSAGQKVLIRMGSFNAEVVKEKLAEVRSTLNQ
jgi:hypothetical protein